MCFIHDHRVAPRGYGLLPNLGLRFFLVAGLVLVFGTSCVQQATQHEGEFLQRGDDDLGAVNQGSGQLFGILINGFDHALRVLDLVIRVLQLLV